MNFQMTPAPTKLMARGRNRSAFATGSYRTRSKRTAVTRPPTTTKTVSNTSQMKLFRSATSVSAALKKNW